MLAMPKALLAKNLLIFSFHPSLFTQSRSLLCLLYRAGCRQPVLWHSLCTIQHRSAAAATAAAAAAAAALRPTAQPFS